MFLAEKIDATTALAAVAVLVCLALTERTRIGRPSATPPGRRGGRGGGAADPPV